MLKTVNSILTNQFFLMFLSIATDWKDQDQKFFSGSVRRHIYRDCHRIPDYQMGSYGLRGRSGICEREKDSVHRRCGAGVLYLFSIAVLGFYRAEGGEQHWDDI